jgi:hypothetical protein
VEVREPFLREEIERERDPKWRADAARPLPQLRDVLVGIGVRRRREQLARKPEHALGFVNDHQVVHLLLEVGEHFDLRQHLHFRNSHEATVE